MRYTENVVSDLEMTKAWGIVFGLIGIFTSILLTGVGIAIYFATDGIAYDTAQDHAALAYGLAASFGAVGTIGLGIWAGTALVARGLRKREG